jgi:hypothetical protein
VLLFHRSLARGGGHGDGDEFRIGSLGKGAGVMAAPGAVTNEAEAGLITHEGKGTRRLDDILISK